MYFPFFYDPTMILIIPALLIAMYAQMKVKGTFNKYLQIRSKSGLTGAEVARQLLAARGLSNVRVEQTRGHLTDHYDPRDKTIKLSPEVYQGSSLASLGVAAHETGHAFQDASEYGPLKFRNNLVPVANLGSQWGLPLGVLGFFFGNEWMIEIGILFFLGAVLFHLVTLPVEFNASNRAIKLLQGHGILSSQEIAGARKVLNAAAFTYVAAALVSVVHLLRLLMLFGLARDDD